MTRRTLFRRRVRSRKKGPDYTTAQTTVSITLKTRSKVGNAAAQGRRGGESARGASGRGGTVLRRRQPGGESNRMKRPAVSLARRDNESDAAGKGDAGGKDTCGRRAVF